MSTEHHNTVQSGDRPPAHSDVSFEPADINTRTILTYLVYLALSVAAAFLISVFVFRSLTKIALESETPPAAIHQGIGPTMPPEPMLQGVPGHTTDPQQDLRNKLAADEAENEKLEWIDKQAGIAQIPVEDAMKIIVTKGLPAVPAPPAEKKK
ncbi:MAG TPA: hypothetical protein VNH65_15365 [Candidatus Acidoferrum sp.]|nr:hypothetical protein [Candidatus Acidoferrum sp.]